MKEDKPTKEELAARKAVTEAGGGFGSAVRSTIIDHTKKDDRAKKATEEPVSGG
ncbi:MAG: hypothetical protein JST12_14725 [Armatimonadetes bacterium]|nr:hypothetical protein [Armatimonadota bacterium]